MRQALSLLVDGGARRRAMAWRRWREAVHELAHAEAEAERAASRRAHRMRLMGYLMLREVRFEF